MILWDSVNAESTVWGLRRTAGFSDWSSKGAIHPQSPDNAHQLSSSSACRLSSSAPTRSTGTQTERPPVLCTLLTAEERERELVRDALTIIDLTLVHPWCVRL